MKIILFGRIDNLNFENGETIRNTQAFRATCSNIAQLIMFTILLFQWSFVPEMHFSLLSTLVCTITIPEQVPSYRPKNMVEYEPAIQKSRVPDRNF
jgi:hypothetical protein